MNDLFGLEAPVHDPGGKVRIKLPSNVVSKAFFSGDQAYRYWLERSWGDSVVDEAVVWIMMNPSTATADVDDPTVAKCRRFATAWGYKRMIVLNVMAYRATHPRDLLAVKDPVGRDNHQHILTTILREKPLIVCAWGNLHPRLKKHGESAAALLRETRHPAHVIRLNPTTQTPGHPLYVTGNATPQPWEPA